MVSGYLRERGARRKKTSREVRLRRSWKRLARKFDDCTRGEEMISQTPPMDVGVVVQIVLLVVYLADLGHQRFSGGPGWYASDIGRDKFVSYVLFGPAYLFLIVVDATNNRLLNPSRQLLFFATVILLSLGSIWLRDHLRRTGKLGKGSQSAAGEKVAAPAWKFDY